MSDPNGKAHFDFDAFMREARKHGPLTLFLRSMEELRRMEREVEGVFSGDVMLRFRDGATARCSGALARRLYPKLYS